jgi:hypothetical protein
MNASYVSSSSRRQTVKVISAKTEAHTDLNYVLITSDAVLCSLTGILESERRRTGLRTLEVTNYAHRYCFAALVFTSDCEASSAFALFSVFMATLISGLYEWETKL